MREGICFSRERGKVALHHGTIINYEYWKWNTHLFVEGKIQKRGNCCTILGSTLVLLSKIWPSSFSEHRIAFPSLLWLDGATWLVLADELGMEVISVTSVLKVKPRISRSFLSLWYVTSNIGHDGIEILEGVLLMEHNLTYPDLYIITDSMKEI